MAQFTIVDNSAAVLRRMITATDSAAAELAEDLVEAVQEKILYGYHDPHGADGHTEIVDTGRLFDSIEAQVKRVSQNTADIRVGATGETPYAVFVHNGTRKLKGRPFIKDGVQGQKEHIKYVLTKNYKNA
jgi:HK97 gp10 family phage protein